MPDKATYAKRRAAGRCMRCRHPATIGVYCAPCRRQRNDAQRARYAAQRPAILAARRQVREARWAAPGTNLIACCGGTLHPIVILPGHPLVVIAACCRRVLGVIPLAEETS